MVKKVACFFTGGYTESNSMQVFLKRINGNIQIKQFCPNRTKRRKRPGCETDLVDEVSGLTGDGLTKYIYRYLTDHTEELTGFDAILIEDDLDGKFYIETRGGDPKSVVSARTAKFTEHCKVIQRTVREKLGADDQFPVILLYASPEIEAWLLSDWAHTFGAVYGPQGMGILSQNENSFFSRRFLPYLRKNVLLQYQNEIESYGYFDGKYRKLSDEIITALENGFKVSLGLEESKLARAIAVKTELRYSKRQHGDAMLLNLSPDSVKGRCPIFFLAAYEQLRAL